jgi:hypothetical protein
MYQRQKMYLGYLIIFGYAIAYLFTSCHNTPALNYKETNLIPGGNLVMSNHDTLIIPIDTLEVMKYEVTNGLFKEFTKATGYVTGAEKNGGSMVFVFDKQQKKMEDGNTGKVLLGKIHGGIIKGYKKK